MDLWLIMKAGKKEIRIEDGVVIGTASDKYESKNFIARKLIDGFDQGVADLARQINAKNITEVGCGEGHVTSILLANNTAPIHAMDISSTMTEEAKANTQSDRVTFEQCNIYDTSADRHAAEFVVCCEVLEHLDNPELGLKKLADLASPYALITVPREPLWCALNMARGAYWSSFGNTPGHLQHWSKRGFKKFIEQYFDIIDTRSPIPWTMLLVKKRDS